LKAKTKKQLISLLLLIALVILLPYLGIELDDVFGPSAPQSGTEQGSDYTLVFPADRYPETGKHIKDAVAAGASAVCTIDREGAEGNREQSLRGIPTKKGFDRDEWPMAMCEEGGEGADIAYISPSDNRGAGAWVSNQLEKYPNGTRILFVVE